MENIKDFDTFINEGRYKWKPNKAQKAAFKERMADPEQEAEYHLNKQKRAETKAAKNRKGSAFDYHSAGGEYIPSKEQYDFTMTYNGELTDEQQNAFNMIQFGYTTKSKVHHDSIHIVNELRRKIVPIVENYNETSWEDEDGNKVTISDIEEYLKDEDVIDIPVVEIQNMCIHKDKKDKATKTRAMKSDLKFPIIIAKKGSKYTMILDGHHRLLKAMNTKKETIKARILDLDNAPDKYKNLFG